MGEPHVSTNCYRTFSRKNNVDRHNKSRHNEMAIVLNKITGWRSDDTKEHHVSYPSPSPPSSFLSLKTPTDAATHNDTIPSCEVL
jgi:hypothetical protein